MHVNVCAQVVGRGQRKSGAGGGASFSSAFPTRTEGRVIVADKVSDCFLAPLNRGCVS